MFTLRNPFFRKFLHNRIRDYNNILEMQVMRTSRKSQILYNPAALEISEPDDEAGHVGRISQVLFMKIIEIFSPAHRIGAKK